MIGIMSDTHEQREELKKALDVFKQKKPDFIVHCGDIISPLMLDHFKGFKMRFIFGNNDGEKQGLIKKAETLGFEAITETKEFEYEKKRFLVIHGHKKEELDDAIKSQRYDYILTGHTHEKRDEKSGKTRIINPGSLFNSPKSIAMLDAKNDHLIFKSWE